MSRTLSAQQLNRALLARQLLLERSRASIPKVLERMGGLQAQYAPSMFVGLAARMAGFERAQLDRSLERRSVVQGTLLRSTIHLVSKSDYWPMAIAVRRARRESWLRARVRRDYSAAQLSSAARQLRSRLGDETMSRKEIHELLGSDSVVTNGVNMWLDLVRVPPSGTWERRRADLYAAAEHWLGPPPRIEEADGIELLVRRYLGGFGPATPAEIANWAGMDPRRLAPALERIDLRRFEAEEGTELVDLPCAPLPDPETPAPVRFLPTWDATLLVHARRTQILPEEHRPKVFNAKTPQSVPAFLVDGRVAGAWRPSCIAGFEPRGGIVRSLVRRVLALAVVISLWSTGCGDSAERPEGPLAQALSEIGGGGEHGSLGVGWTEPRLAARSGVGPRLMATALAPNAESIVHVAPSLRRRFGFDPLSASRLVSVGGSYAFGLRIDGTNGAGLRRALLRAGGRIREGGQPELIDVGDYAVVPEPLLEEGVFGLGARDAFGRSTTVLAISDTARNALLGRGDRLIDEPVYRAAADCLGDVVAARMVPDKLLLSTEVGVDLVAVGIRREGEVLCVLGGTAQRADRIATALESSLGPDARDPRTGEPLSDSVRSVEVATASYDGVHVVRAGLSLAEGQPRGFLFGTIARGSLVQLINGR